MAGVGRQLFVPLSLAVGFSMISSYLFSSSLVPVLSTWIMREGHRGESRLLQSFYERYLAVCCGSVGRWRSVTSRSLAFWFGRRPAGGTKLFPDANPPLMRIRLRAPTGTRIEETERIVLRALDVINREIGAGNVEITSDFLGVHRPVIQ